MSAEDKLNAVMDDIRSAAEDRLRGARTRMLRVDGGQPFFGFVSMTLILKKADEWCPTLATDGIHLFYNEEFVNKQTKSQLTALVWHEGYHVYMLHPARIAEITGCRDKHTDEGIEPHTCSITIAQWAADMAINPKIKDAGGDLPPDAVYPEREFWDDSMEGHFKRMKKSAKTVCQPLPPTGGCGGVQAPKGKDGKPLNGPQMEQWKATVERNIHQAYNFAKGIGVLPADVERRFAEMSRPRVPWQERMRRFMLSPAKDDYRMLPPNRRYIHAGLYLPSLTSETVGDVLLLLDGSGSTMAVFDQFMTEFVAIYTDVRSEQLHVMVWDTQLSWYRSFDRNSDETTSSICGLKGEMGAGGGSDFQDCFDWFARETGITPQVAVVLTDLEILFPNDPGYPVMWISTEDHEAPFGETVLIDAERSM